MQAFFTFETKHSSGICNTSVAIIVTFVRAQDTTFSRHFVAEV